METASARLTREDIRNQATYENGVWFFGNRPAAAWFCDGGSDDIPVREANKAHLIATTLELMEDDE